MLSSVVRKYIISFAVTTNYACFQYMHLKFALNIDGQIKQILLPNWYFTSSSNVCVLSEITLSVGLLNCALPIET